MESIALRIPGQNLKMCVGPLPPPKQRDNGCPMGGKTSPTTIVLSSIFALCCLIVVFAVRAPLSQPRIPLNHMRAANSSAQLIAAERQYASRLPATGFTCDFGQLAEADLIDKVLASGNKAGYHYELHGCDAPPIGSVYSFTAAPISPGKTGKFTFCANQEGVLWYATGGSADECFKARTTWTKSDVWR